MSGPTAEHVLASRREDLARARRELEGAKVIEGEGGGVRTALAVLHVNDAVEALADASEAAHPAPSSKSGQAKGAPGQTQERESEPSPDDDLRFPGASADTLSEIRRLEAEHERKDAAGRARFSAQRAQWHLERLRRRG